MPSHAGPLGLLPRAGAVIRVVTWVSSSDRQAGSEHWHTASRGDLLCQLCLHCPRWSLLAGQNGLSQQQPHRPALCTQELNLPSLIENLHCSSCAAAHHGLCSNPTSLRADPVLFTLFHPPGHINTDFLHSPSLNDFFYLPVENFALLCLL